jgi:DNA adenine methylase
MKKNSAKPFLKWAGGKTQLIKDISNALPHEIINTKFTYIEPFVGSGAVLFWMLNNFPKIEKAVINDINEDLINAYNIIKLKPIELITKLETLQNEYYELESQEEVKVKYYYSKRELYNKRKSEQTEHAALFIFLNRTCFNGLYRVNRKNEFNVPIGRYQKPMICDRENILAVSQALQNVEIMCGDYAQTIKKRGSNTFFYFDPPYKPLSETSNFNSYARENFNDNEQIRLRDFCVAIESLGDKWMLSNSDINSINLEDSFFEEIYSGFFIERVKAKRFINSNVEKRGELSELLITNYINEQTLLFA